MFNPEDFKPFAKVVEKVYDDALSPAAKEVGKALETTIGMVNTILIPFRLAVVYGEAQFNKIVSLVQDKHKNTSLEYLVGPDPHVVGPAMQAISFCMDEETLRDMYANLLANSMHIQIKNDIHPSFVHTISQLNPLDAENLQLFKLRNFYPIVAYHPTFNGFRMASTGHYHFLANKNQTDYFLQSESLSNLERLGLVKINPDAKVNPVGMNLIDPIAYREFDSHPLKESLKESISSVAPVFGEADIQTSYGSVYSTPYGKKFLKTCVSYP